ncbi:MAG TPA: hypothetical protein VKW04_07460 [Planctomycetota bacterium]|nr:hypothetical protein [Planctomycetota bacterium]
MAVLLLFLAALQETDVIPRGQRDLYLAALREYDTAWSNLDSDPKTALSAIERLFAMRLEKKDRRITLERPNGMLQKPQDFFPNYLRGRIRLSLAKSDPDNAHTYLTAALGDFKASSDAGVKASDDLLKSTRALLDRPKTPKAPDVPAKAPPADEAFRESWFTLIQAHKFKAAQDLVDQKGTALKADRKRDYLRETDQECRKYVTTQLESFAKAMEITSRPMQLRATRLPEFNRLFELPAQENLVFSSSDLDWVRTEKTTLEALRLSTLRAREEEYPGLLGRLLAQMVAAEPLDRTGDNKWFRLSGQLTFRYLEEVLLSLVAQSKDAPADLRHRLHEAAEKVRARWPETLANFQKDFLTRNQVFDNAKRLSALLDDFPVDVDELEKLSLDACLSEVASPDTALEHMISDLTKIRDAHGARLPRESLRKLLTELVAASAAHDLLSGKKPEDVSKELQELGRSLAQAGGALNPDRFGPKIEKIFAALR